MNVYIEKVGSVNYCNASCPYSNGCIYASYPSKVRCTLDDDYYVVGEPCKHNEERNNKEMSNNMDKSMEKFPDETEKKEVNTLVVNLFGSPGTGKSTFSAYIFSQLKMRGINAELATEFAKDKVWEESVEVFKNQAYIFGKQYFRLSRVKGKVDVIVTDSPIILSMFYNNQPELDENFDRMCMKVFNSFNNYNVFLTRVKPYNPAGRFQTEEESDALVRPMIDMLQKNGVTFDVYNGDQESADKIVNNIMNILNKN